MDLAYGTGLLAFDEVCKRVEALALHNEDEIKTAFTDTQVIPRQLPWFSGPLTDSARLLQKDIKNLVAQLTAAYRHRDSLWTDLEDNLEKCGISRILICSDSILSHIALLDALACSPARQSGCTEYT